jgi:hypothetical protein
LVISFRAAGGIVRPVTSFRWAAPILLVMITQVLVKSTVVPCEDHDQRTPAQRIYSYLAIRKASVIKHLEEDCEELLVGLLELIQ